MKNQGLQNSAEAESKTNSLQKIISKKTLATINHITPDELEAHGVIESARTSGFICPNCGNGTGSKGTGISQIPNIDATIFKCFSCQNTFSVMRLCAKFYQLDARADFIQLVERICSDFNISLEYDEFTPTAGKRTARRKKSVSPVDNTEMKFIKEDLATSEQSLINYCENTGGSLRGLPIQILLKHGARLIFDWTHPKNRTEKSTPTARMIIPNSHGTGYLARLIDSPANYGKAAEFIKGTEKQVAGKSGLFNEEALYKDFVIVVEGPIDMMSLELAGFNAIAIGGVSNIDILIDALQLRDGKPPMIMILFDNDEAGRKAAENLLKELLAMRIPAVATFLDKESAPTDSISGSAKIGKLDANSILQDRGKDVLQGCVQILVDGAMPELYALAAQFGKKDFAGLSAEDWDKIFSGDTSDLDYSYRLERFCGDVVRWLTDVERWMIYTGGVWLKGTEKNSAVAPFGRRLAEAMNQNAQGQDERDLADKFKSSKKQSQAFTLLKAAESIRITAEDLDKHPNLLNCRDCVVDLQTGQKHSHDSSLLITKQCGAAYDENADTADVEEFFKQIMPDEETRAGFKRSLGYSATGSVREEKFFIWRGDGGNGKGVTSLILVNLLGGYAACLPQNAFVVPRFTDGNAHTAALNALDGARFAISEELPQNAHLNIALLKKLSGGDTQTLRRLHEEYKNIEPTAKIFLSSNFIPNLDNVDSQALRRRMIVIPFNVTFDNPDLHLKEKLLTEANQRGLLKILVDEAVAWYRDGLIISDAMKKATQNDLDANDWLNDFLEEYCCKNPNGEIPRSVLLEKIYEKCPQVKGLFNKRALTKMIERRGFKYDRGKKGMVFKGIQFFDNNSPDADFNGTPIPPDRVPF